MALLKGKSQQIIDQNIKDLKQGGLSEAHATHLALKHANKGKMADRAKAGVMKKPSKPMVEVRK